MSAARLFAALRPPAYARDDLIEKLSGLNISRRQLVPNDDWHVTVAFIGSVHAEAFHRVATAVAETARQVPRQMSLLLAGGGRFDRGGRNIVHVGVDGDVAALTRMAADLDARLGRVGFPGKERAYVPHLTVSYVHDCLSERDIAADVEVLEKYRGPRWVATDLVLYRSQTRSAARYQQLRRYVLP